MPSTSIVKSNPSDAAAKNRYCERSEGIPRYFRKTEIRGRIAMRPYTRADDAASHIGVFGEGPGATRRGASNAPEMLRR